MKKGWLKESMRDIMALGGIPFFLLVLVRVWMLSKPDYFSQFLIGGLVFFGFVYLFKANINSGLGLIILTFTSLYYEDLKFSIFGGLLYFGLLFSLINFKKTKKEITLGVMFGIVSIIISYFGVKLFFA